MFKSVLKRHAKMLFDLRRTLPLIEAIRKKTRPGDIVVDVGCGLGILSLTAVKAGAKRVYAIDVDSEALEFARWQAKKMGVGEKICWLNDHSYNVDLMEKADLLIQETIGAMAFDENFLPTLCDAKKRFLKKGGKIIPEIVALYGAPATQNKKLLQNPALLHQIKTKTPSSALGGERVRERVTTEIRIEKTWKISRLAAGILVWPKITWAKGLETDASPLKQPTHWRQTFLAGSGHRLTLKFLPDRKDPLHYTQVFWRTKNP